MPTVSKAPKTRSTQASAPAVKQLRRADKGTLPNWRSKKEAPREKLLRLGVDKLSNHELLAIFLRTGYKGKGVMELAHELLETKGLRWLMTAEYKDFMNEKGLGVSQYAQLRAVMELARRYLQHTLEREEQGLLNSPSAVSEYLCCKLGDVQHEVFSCLFLDAGNRLLEYQEMFRGTVDSANVSPREIVRRALELNATGLIMVHNHPSGNLKPSLADRQVTKVIAASCKQMGISLLDHIIVSGDQSISFCSAGLL